MPIMINDPADPRVTDFTQLTDVALRRTTEPARGLYLAESERVIRRALAVGHRARSYLMAERWIEPLADLVADAERHDVPVYVGSAEVLCALTGFHLHRGAIAAMHRPVLPSPAELLGSVKHSVQRVAILEDIVDHTNVGAVFRSAAALSVNAVFVTPRCADPLYRRAVRVSMGTVFQVPWTRLSPWPECLDTVRSYGFTVAALTPTAKAISIDDINPHELPKLALIMGTEGAGVSEKATQAADFCLRIPMAGGVDSLNVAAASAVAFWALRASWLDKYSR
ncbi:MAG: TrmH family RNA methyltransferase [Actinomycetota bacterium]